LAIQHLCRYTDKIVTLFQSKQFNYRNRYAQRHGVPSWFDSSDLLINDDDIYEDFINYFFKDSKILFQQQQLVNKWDQREFLALNLRPFDPVTLNDVFDYDISHYALDTSDLYNTFDHSVKDLANYLEIKIDFARYDSWHKVYCTWKKIHTQQQLFTWYFDRIIDYIINGHNLDLTRFELDIVQEATIQHTLIYKHNLNLKTWQLEKFKNTQQLHNLLEPNIHALHLDNY
jgi:hypothetical protein